MRCIDFQCLQTGLADVAIAQSLKITDSTLRRQAEGIGQIHLISAH